MNHPIQSYASQRVSHKQPNLEITARNNRQAETNGNPESIL